MRTLQVTQAIVTLECYACQILFGITERLYELRRDDGRSFWCPNGHQQHFTESTVQRLEKEKAALARQVEKEKADKQWYQDRLDGEQKAHSHTERRLRGTRSVVTRMKRRIVAGSCVCCSKKFKDLERHMKNQHPDWNPDKAIEALAGKVAE